MAWCQRDSGRENEQEGEQPAWWIDNDQYQAALLARYNKEAAEADKWRYCQGNHQANKEADNWAACDRDYKVDEWAADYRDDKVDKWATSDREYKVHKWAAADHDEDKMNAMWAAIIELKSELVVARGELVDVRRELVEVKGDIDILEKVIDRQKQVAAAVPVPSGRDARPLSAAGRWLGTAPSSASGECHQPSTELDIRSSMSSTMPICAHHVHAPKLSLTNYAAYGTPWKRLEDPWWSHLQSTLFRSHNKPLDEVWYKYRTCDPDQFTLDACITQANRYFVIGCNACGRAVKGEYDEAHPNKMQAADDLCSFFGVGLCSTREQLTGCHVLRKEALQLQELF